MDDTTEITAKLTPPSTIYAKMVGAAGAVASIRADSNSMPSTIYAKSMVGSVTSVSTGTGLTGGPVTTTGTIALANTAVTAGGYQSPYIQVDAQGRLTKALDEPCSDEIHFSGGASLNAGILTATGVVEWETPIVSSVARTGIFAGIATFTQFSILEYTFNSTAAVEEFLQVTGGGFTHVFNAVKSEIIVQSSTEIITRLTGSVTNLGGTALPTRPAIAIFRVTPAGASGGAFTLTLKVQKEFLYTGTSPVVVTGRAISLVATTSAGTYATPSSITVDATGRVTAATAGASGDYLALSGGTVTGNIALLGTMTATGNIGIGAASPSAKLHSVATTEQLRLGYNNSNYISATVSSLGRVTLDAVGASGATGAGFILAKQTQLTGQTIVDNNSAITKGWVGMASQMNQSNTGANGLWTLITTAQAGTYLGSNTAGEIRLDAADATNFGSITVNLVAFSGIGPPSSLSPNRQPNFNFSNRVGFSFFIKSGGDSFNPSLQSWAYAIGSYDSFVSHTIQSLYPLNQSSGGYRAYICVTCINGEVVLRVSDRTANRVDSSVLDTITGVFGKNYAVIVEGGIASLYRDNTYLGSVSGATIHADCNGAVGGAFFHHSASAVGTTTRRRVSIYNGRAWW